MATILVAEDRTIDREFLAKLFGYRGHHVLEACDGVEALSIAQQQRPQLIVSDVLMPTMDGYEFVRRLREVEGIRDTPVIFYTATYHEREARALATKCGVVEILTKPSEPEVILARVDAVLSRRSRPSVPESADRELFDREHVRLINAKLSNKVHDLEAAEQRLAAVVDSCQHFAIERDPLALLRRVCRVTRDVTLAKQAVVALVNADGTAVEQLLTSGFDEQTVRTMDSSAPLADVLRDVLVARHAVRRRNVSGRPDALGLPTGQPDVFSYLAVPVASPSRVYGWISVRNKLGADEFTDADEKVALILGVHAGIAYENTRLIDDLRGHATALRESEERTHYALGAARMGVWELDLTTDRVTWSDTLAPMFGLTPDQAPKTGEAFFSLIHPDDRQALADSVSRVAQEGTEYEVEFRAILPDGRTRWMAGRARAFRNADGTPLRLLGVGMDISERKSLEAQLRQSQKLEAIGQLAGGVAHDFNNVLTAILGYSNFVMDTFDADDRRRSDLQEVIGAGQRAATLTRQLLAFSRKQVLQPIAVDLNSLVTGLRQMLGRLIGEQVDLVTVLAPDLHVVRADAGQLEQIVMNLVVNARDAMPVGGRVSIETANVDLDESYAMAHKPVRPGTYVMLAVSDSGIGMNEEIKRRLFEPFFTTKEQGKGTGLGLATVYGIVKQSGGYIWVYSELGAGTTFKVYLPRADADQAVRTPVTTEDVTATGTETVLVVEDEEAVRFLTRVILEKAGYRVFDAPNPREAEALFEENPMLFDLLVTDVIMPGSSGPRLFERLTQRRPNLKVLYVSGYTDDAIVHHGQLDPGVEFLQKPFTAGELNRRVREVLDR